MLVEVDVVSTVEVEALVVVAFVVDGSGVVDGALLEAFRLCPSAKVFFVVDALSVRSTVLVPVALAVVPSVDVVSCVVVVGSVEVVGSVVVVRFVEVVSCVVVGGSVEVVLTVDVVGSVVVDGSVEVAFKVVASGVVMESVPCTRLLDDSSPSGIGPASTIN